MRIDPTLIQPYMGMANIAEQRKDPTTALKYLREAQQRNRHELMEPIIARKLAWLLAAAPQEQLRSGPEALQLAMQSVELTGGRDPYCLHTLAVALAENGDFDKAITVARNAAALARQGGQQELVDQLSASDGDSWCIIGACAYVYLHEGIHTVSYTHLTLPTKA